jgi:hypothetical protein
MPLPATRTPTVRPPRTLRLAAFCAASAAIALMAAVTGVELARVVDHDALTTPEVVEPAPKAPPPKATTPLPPTTAKASERPVLPAEVSDVPLVRADELPLAKESNARKRVKPVRRFRAPARR